VYTLPGLNQEYHLDLGSQTPVHLKTLAIFGDKVLCEYLDSTPGRTELLSLELF